MIIIWSPCFRQAFALLPDEIKDRARQKLALFGENPHHPSLRTKKMEGFQNRWEGRITQGYRFTFAIEGDTCVLRRIGAHDILRHP
jgi:hypothetical protein